MNTFPRHSPPRRQQGAVLAFGLVLLLIVTMLGVSALRTSLLEEKMSSNVQDSNVALQGAEAAVRAGELFLQQAVLPPFTEPPTSAGLYGEPPVPIVGRALWKSAGTWAAAIPYSMSTAPGALTKVDARYFIEEMPLLFQPGESLAVDVPLDEIAFYRVTGRAIGVGGGATVTIQTTFKR